MNKQPDITRRQQQEFLRKNGIRLLHFSVRACPCNGVGCNTCKGRMKYFDDPVPTYGALVGGRNTSKKEAQFPTFNMSDYTLILEPRFRVAKGDRLLPMGTREFETTDEVLPVFLSKLTYRPINPRMIQISLSGPQSVINCRPIRDFTVELEYLGSNRVPLFSKQIKWITDLPTGHDYFSARYAYYPEFEIDEIPEAITSQGQLLMSQIKVKKITVGGDDEERSYEDSANAVRGGIKYE